MAQFAALFQIFLTKASGLSGGPVFEAGIIPGAKRTDWEV
jgi:hypothetical protein